MLVVPGTPSSGYKILSLTLSDIDTIINGLDLLAAQVDVMGKDPKNKIRILEKKIRKARA